MKSIIKKVLDIFNSNAKKQINTESGETDDTKSNDFIVEQIPIKGTPFTAIKYNEEWFLTMGKYRLTNGLKTSSQAIKEAKNADWYRIMQIMQIVIDENKKKDELKEHVINNEKSFHNKTN